MESQMIDKAKKDFEMTTDPIEKLRFQYIPPALLFKCRLFIKFIIFPEKVRIPSCSDFFNVSELVNINLLFVSCR